MSKKTWAMIFKTPALLILICAALIGVYGAYYNVEDMGWEVPIILFATIFLYYIGSLFERSYHKELMIMRKELKEEEEEDDDLAMNRTIKRNMFPY